MVQARLVDVVPKMVEMHIIQPPLITTLMVMVLAMVIKMVTHLMITTMVTHQIMDINLISIKEECRRQHHKTPLPLLSMMNSLKITWVVITTTTITITILKLLFIQLHLTTKLFQNKQILIILAFLSQTFLRMIVHQMLTITLAPMSKHATKAEDPIMSWMTTITPIKSPKYSNKIKVLYNYCFGEYSRHSF